VTPVIIGANGTFSISLRQFSFHLAVCLTTGPKPLPKRALHIVRSNESILSFP
jgi:hypothetical protein